MNPFEDQVHIYDHVLDTLKQKRTVSKDTYSLFFQVCHEGATVPKWKEILEAMFLMQDFDLNAIHEETHRTGLSFAAHAGNVEVVQFLLSLTSIDPVKCNDTKLSPLHFACMSDSPDTVRELVKHPKVCDNINAVSSTWRTALTIACESGSLDMVNILLGVEGIDITAWSNLPLGLSAHSGAAKIVARLCSVANQKGITLAQTCKSHPSATQFYILSFTASAGKLEALKALIEVGGFDPDITDADNASPIMFAAAEGHVSIVKYLLKTGRVDINRAGAPNGDTALHFACHGGHIGVVKVLLEDSKLDVNALRAGSTALADSCFDGNHTVATLLLSDPRIDVNKGTEGVPAANAACKGHIDILNLLLMAGRVDWMRLVSEVPILAAAIQSDMVDAFDFIWEIVKDEIDINRVYGKYGTLLTMAAASGAPKTMLRLISAGADMEMVTSEGSTALFFAIEDCISTTSIELIQLYASRGKSETINSPQGNSGDTVLISAVSGGLRDVVSTLLTCRSTIGLDINAMNADGETALYVASYLGLYSMVEMLIECFDCDWSMVMPNGETATSIAEKKGMTRMVSCIENAVKRRGANLYRRLLLVGAAGVLTIGVAGLYILVSSRHRRTK